MFNFLEPEMWNLIFESTGQTLYMVLASGFFASVLGIPLGVILYLTRKGRLKENFITNFFMGISVNFIRSIPFVILLVSIIPFTRLIVGTFLGTTAVIVPLTVCAFPFMARLTEGVLLEIPDGLIEAARSMGASDLQIIVKFLLAESVPGLINAVTITLVNLVDAAAVAGVVGGGGLGYIGLRFGYQDYKLDILIVVILLLVAIVQLIQFIGDRLVLYFNHK